MAEKYDMSAVEELLAAWHAQGPSVVAVHARDPRTLGLHLSLVREGPAPRRRIPVRTSAFVPPGEMLVEYSDGSVRRVTPAGPAAPTSPARLAYCRGKRGSTP